MIGYIATLILIIAYFPQCYKLWKYNDTSCLSLPTFLLVTTAMICMTVHAINIKDIPLLLNGIFSGCQNGYILYKIFKNG
jgi:uncharacterized protein with PQ loop repeat